MNREALTARLLVAFLEDLDEQLRTLDADLLVLERQPQDRERLNRIFRAAHTLKGAARAAGVSYIEPACHALEDLLAAVRDGRRTLGAAEFTVLFFAADALADAGARLKRGASLDEAPVSRVEGRVAALAHGSDALPPVPTSATALPPAGGGVDLPSSAPGAEIPPSFAGPASPAATTIRVQADKIDAMLTAGSQLVVSRSRLRARSQQVDALHDFLLRWSADWRKTGPVARQSLQQHALGAQLLPMLDNFDGTLRRLLHSTDSVARGAAADGELFGDLIGRLFERIQEVRMHPVTDACAPLSRVVRDVSAMTGKTATLVVLGGDVEADRAVLDVVRDALLHLVRNAVDHGIELPAVRTERGKPPMGTVTVAAALRGDRLVITVTDDGGGVDLEAVRAALADRGLPVPTHDEEVLRTLFLGGLSTRGGITEISGRGVGLDAVQALLQRVGGTVRVTSTPGHGTTFMLECPLTLATIRALLVSVGAHVFAIPTSYVASLRRARADEIRRAEGRDVLLTGDAPIPVVPLARLLGTHFVEKPVTDAASVVLLRATEGELAIAVEQLLDEDEIVVQPIARVGDAVPLLTGAAVLGSGEIAFVLNIAEVIPTGLGVRGGQRLVAERAVTARKQVLVVDDSITTRTLEQSTIEAAGYDVTTAADGAEAWRLVQASPFDLVVSDIEMPRMDGIALCEAIRASPRHRELPVVLVTALESPEQRLRGLEAGASAYLGKSAFDQAALVDTIRQLVG